MSFADIKIKAGAGMFFKVESGTPMVVRLLHDDPFQYVQHGFGKIAEECSGENCLFCQEKDADGNATDKSKRKQRFKLNIYSHDSQKVMIWEFGPQVMGLIQNSEASLKIQGLNILDVDLMVTSNGEMMDKEYSIQPMLKSRDVPAGLTLHKLDLPF